MTDIKPLEPKMKPPTQTDRRFTPEQIYEVAVRVAKGQVLIEELKDKIKTDKVAIQEMVLAVKVDNLREFIFNAYWQHRAIHSNTLRKLVGERIDKDAWKGCIIGTVEWKCSKCDMPFTRKFASRTAYDARNQRESEGICPECQAEILTQRETAEQERQAVFWANVEKLQALPYDEYLQTEHWKEIRKRVLKYFGYKCTKCKSSENLQVHHLNYDHIGHERFNDLTLLCGDCHAEVHGKPKKPVAVAHTKKDNGQ